MGCTVMYFRSRESMTCMISMLRGKYGRNLRRRGPGDRENAAADLQRSLELDSDFEASKDRLRELGVPGYRYDGGRS